MTTKEKAEELVEKYFKFLNYEFGDAVYSSRDKQPHKCALIAVDEILKEYSVLQIETDFCYKQYLYWQEVKSEIEKL